MGRSIHCQVKAQLLNLLIGISFLGLIKESTKVQPIGVLLEDILQQYSDWLHRIMKIHEKNG